MVVVSSLDCCLYSFSSTTNRFFLDDFVADNFVPGENWCECLRTGLALSGVTTSDTFLFLASLETLTFTSRLTAVETNLYVSARFRSFLAHGLQTTCDDDRDCSSAIPTDFNFL